MIRTDGPLEVGGVKSSGETFPLQIDSSGNLKVTSSGGAGSTISLATSTPGSPAAVSVGIASTAVLGANGSRLGLILVNTSANYISLGFGAAAVLYSGITLSPGGGAFTASAGTLSAGTVTAIASGASSNLGVQEFS